MKRLVRTRYLVRTSSGLVRYLSRNMLWIATKVVVDHTGKRAMKKRYTNVANSLLEEIRSGAFQVGDTMPSEADLVARFGVSRSTVRSALSQLQSLGIVERKQGAPTRIKATEIAPTYVHTMSATGDLMLFAGRSSWREVQKIEPVVADESLASRLDGRPGRRWVRISQLRRTEGQQAPVGWTDIYLCDKYGDIADDVQDYPGLVYLLLEERHSVLIHEIVQSISSITVPDSLADKLEAKQKDLALELTRHYLNAEGKSLIVSISVLPACHYHYEIRLKRQVIPTALEDK